MNNYFNQYDEENNVRPPDKVKLERLIGDYDIPSVNFDKQLNDVIHKSLKEYEETNNIDDVMFKSLQEFEEVNDLQMIDVVCQSLKEMEDIEKYNKEYEEKLIQDYLNEKTKRENKFSSMLMIINRLMRFNNDVKEIYEIISPIIDSYCEQRVERVMLNEETYDKVFKCLNNIKNNEKNVEILKQIIIKS